MSGLRHTIEVLLALGWSAAVCYWAATHPLSGV